MIVSNAKSLGEALRMGRFQPAKVQREFQWKTSNVERLLDDVLAAFERMGCDPGEADEVVDDDHDGEAVPVADGGKPIEVKHDHRVARISGPVRQMPNGYFLGGIILWSNEKSATYTVYDGLQRLTSINILLIALRDSWGTPEPGDVRAIDELLYDLDDEYEKEARLKFPTTGGTLANYLGRHTLPRNVVLTGGDIRMREAAETLDLRFAKGWPVERRRAFLAFLRDKVWVTVTETANHSVAYQMFVGANTRGLPLAIGDVTKGLMADRLRVNGGSVDEINACLTGWRDAQKTLRGSFENFLNAVEVLKFREELPTGGGRDGRADAHETGEKIQAYLDSDVSPATISDWIGGEFKRQVAVFERSRLHNTLEYATGADISFSQLSFLSWTEWHPLYLAIGLQHPQLEGPQFIQAVSDLKRACYIVELLDDEKSTRRRKFLKAVEQLEQGIDPYAWHASRERKGALHFSKKGGLARAKLMLRAQLVTDERRGAIVRWIETLHWGESVPRRCTDDASVEHVLPIAAMNGWRSLFTPEECLEWTNKLGNLCILDKETNQWIGNKDWPIKQAEFEKWATTFKGVGHVLGASQKELATPEARPWCVPRVKDLTEQLARKAEIALAL